MSAGAGQQVSVREILSQMVIQNEFTSHFCFDRVTEDNARLRVSEAAASVGFIYRHIGETINLFAQMLGVPSDVKNTTIGKSDTGQHCNVADSRALIQRGYRSLQELIERSTDEDWLKPINTPFFGPVARVRLLAHTLYHTSNHAGQISLTLARANQSA